MTAKQENIIGLSIISLLIVLGYMPIFRWMYGRYIGADSYYSHGFLVPFVSLYLIWLKRELTAFIPQRQCSAGLVVIIFALILHILGTALYIFVVSGFSLFFLVIGLSLFIFGREITKAVLFPIHFLIFMFPIPEAVISIISFPLKLFAAKAGVWAVSMFGIPVYGEGFNIYIPAGHLLVGNPCSGLRSIIAFMALGSVFSYLTQLSMGKKWILFLSSIPIALVSNIIRVPILILVSHFWGLKAAAPDTFVHVGSGMLAFVIGFILLKFSAKVLK